jgi:hypothetical protein
VEIQGIVRFYIMDARRVQQLGWNLTHVVERYDPDLPAKIIPHP